MCKRKENGDDVPLGAPSPHPQNVSDIGTTDTSSTAHAISNEDLKQLVQHYHDIIAQKNEVISQQNVIIQQKEDTIQQQGQIISIKDTHIQRLEDDNSQLRESIHKQSATIDILTKRISELENYLESVAYNKPANVESQPDGADLKLICDTLSVYISKEKNDRDRIHKSISTLMKSNHLAVVAQPDNPQKRQIVVTAQFLSEFIRVMLEIMNSTQRRAIVSKRKGVIPAMAQYIKQNVKLRRGNHGPLTSICYDSLRETIRRAAIKYTEEHKVSATF